MTRSTSRPKPLSASGVRQTLSIPGSIQQGLASAVRGLFRRARLLQSKEDIRWRRKLTTPQTCPRWPLLAARGLSGAIAGIVALVLTNF
jgi:hypothetical protein